MKNPIYIPKKNYEKLLKLNSTQIQNLSNDQLLSTLQLIDYAFLSYHSIIPNPDHNIRKLGISVYDKTLNDPVVQGCTDTIIQTVKSLEYEIINNNCSQNEIDLDKIILNNLFENGLIDQILLAILYGNQYIELIYNKDNNLLYPSQSLVRPHSNFYYRNNNDTNIIELLALTEENPTIGETVPKFKLLVPTYKSTYSNPYGKGLLSNCYKSVFIKDNAWDFWSIFVEDHGTPKIDAEITMELVNYFESKLNFSPNEILNTIQEDIKTLRQNGSFTHFEGINVKPLDTTSAYSGVTHKDLMDFCDKQIAILLLGHNGSSQATPGKLGNENMALEILESRINSYSKFVADNCNILLRWIHNLNFGNTKPPQIRFFKKNDTSNLKSQADVDQILVNIGLELSDDYFSEMYNIDKKYIIGRITKTTSPPTSPPTPLNLPKQNDYSQQINNRFINAKKDIDAEKAVQSLKVLDDFSKYIQESVDITSIKNQSIKTITDYLDNCESYDDALKGLFNLYPDLSNSDFIDLLNRMLTVTHLYGYSQGDDNGN